MTRTNRPPLPCALCAALALLTLGAPAQAQGTAYHAGVQLSIEDQLFEDSRDGPLDGSQSPLDSTLTLPDGDSVRASASAGLGVNKAVAQIRTVNADTPVRLAYTLATNTYWDQITISDPALDGTLGSFTTTLLVNGSGSFAASDSWANTLNVSLTAQWLSRITVGNAESGFQDNAWFGAWKRNFGTGDIDYVGAPLNSFQQEATFTFTYGQPFALGVMLQTYIQLDNPLREPGTLDATLDLGNSAYWGGMTIRDADGHVVDGATLASDSGLDWRLPVGVAAVPEPASAALMLLGLFAIGGGRMSRRRAATTG